ncbi:hypothetical protein JCM11491_002163 [Sporobolomyces phaffii]
MPQLLMYAEVFCPRIVLTDGTNFVSVYAKSPSPATQRKFAVAFQRGEDIKKRDPTKPLDPFASGQRHALCMFGVDALAELGVLRRDVRMARLGLPSVPRLTLDPSQIFPQARFQPYRPNEASEKVGGLLEKGRQAIASPVLRFSIRSRSLTALELAPFQTDLHFADEVAERSRHIPVFAAAANTPDRVRRARERLSGVAIPPPLPRGWTFV